MGPAASDEAVVMLHGWGSNITLFENAAKLISEKYYVVAPDMPGFGETAEPGKAWSVDDYTDFIIEFIEKRSEEYSRIIFDTEDVSFELNGNNIDISYQGKNYENLSGGEKQKVDIIVQFSIRDMLCQQVGFSSNILVLDEVFDGLDNLGCQRVISMITNLQDVRNVFIVTHRKDLSIPCDKDLIVIKSSNGISRIKE
jgi:DNA repair exonuclease SbcCD ATPase subunit